MADITTTAVSYDLPNYIGEIFFQKSERPNAFLRLIGGLGGAVRTVGHWEYAMGANYQLATQTQPAILEGADPTFREEEVTQASNLLQIFQEGVSMTYSAESSRDSIGGVAVIPGAGNGEIVRPRSMEFQIQRTIERLQGKMNVSFLKGAYQKPTDNTTARKTRGVITSVTTNAVDLAAAALTKANFESSLKTMMGNGMFIMGADLYLLADATALEKVIALYASSTQLPISREVAGVSIKVIVTTWCTLNLVYEPDVTAGTLFITNPSRIQPVALPVIVGGVSKGLLFRETLAHTGAKTNEQIYGEWGVDYTDEIFHGTVSNYT